MKAFSLHLYEMSNSQQHINVQLMFSTDYFIGSIKIVWLENDVLRIWTDISHFMFECWYLSQILNMLSYCVTPAQKNYSFLFDV